jgi:hypothetical protein
MRAFLRRSFSKVSAEQVRVLRDMTGAPLLQCKNILTECQGDLEKAKSLLREKNLIFAEKKAGADAKEGVAFIQAALGIRSEPNQEERSAHQLELRDRLRCQERRFQAVPRQHP